MPPSEKLVGGCCFIAATPADKRKKLVWKLRTTIDLTVSVFVLGFQVYKCSLFFDLVVQIH